jgi:hypothetical protein
MYIAQGCLSNTKPGFNNQKKNSDFDNYFKTMGSTNPN